MADMVLYYISLDFRRLKMFKGNEYVKENQ